MPTLLDDFLGGVPVIVLKELFEAPPESRAPLYQMPCVYKTGANPSAQEFRIHINQQGKTLIKVIL